MWNSQWMDWGINPRTGQSMNMIQGPFGQIPANVFMQVPKELFFMNSREYCCYGSNEVNFQTSMNSIASNYYTTIANLNPCCNSVYPTNIPNTFFKRGGG